MKTPTKTSILDLLTAAQKEELTKCRAILSSDDFKTHLMYLCSRWQDEKKYEDINDYLHSVQTFVGESVKILRISKAPFGLFYKIGPLEFHFFMKRQGVNMQFFTTGKRA